MDTIINFFRKPIVRRLLLLAVIAFVLYLMRGMITFFLLTFIFIYLINAAQKFIYRHVHKYIPVNRSFIIIFIYCVVIALLVLILYIYAPQIVNQLIAVTKQVTRTIKHLLKAKSTGNDILDLLLSQVRSIDIKSYAANGGKYLVSFIGSVGTLGIYFFLSILLSMFFMLQKNRIYAFMRSFKASKLSWLYDEIAYFGTKFTNTFGKVLQTQITISFINCLLSMVLLAIMRFPNVLGLGVMIFLLGIIPVAGVFISLVPLSIIAYNVGQWRYIIYVLIMIAILHALEAYVLNPKLMSEKTHLPIFFTFFVLIVSEHFFGIWGLLVGIPVFVFLLDILDVKIPDKKVPLPSASEIKARLEKNLPKPEANKSEKGGKGSHTNSK